MISIDLFSLRDAPVLFVLSESRRITFEFDMSNLPTCSGGEIQG